MSKCFDDNKAYLHMRLDEEQNPKVKKMLKKDMEFLDQVQVEMATARQFLFIARCKAKKPEQVFQIGYLTNLSVTMGSFFALFRIQKVEEVNRGRKYKAPGRKLEGESFSAPELNSNPSVALGYIVAPPRMAHYMEVSTKMPDRTLPDQSQRSWLRGYRSSSFTQYPFECGVILLIPRGAVHRKLNDFKVVAEFLNCFLHGSCYHFRRILKCSAWYYNISSAEIIHRLPIKTMKRIYVGLCDLPLEKAVQKVGCR